MNHGGSIVREEMLIAPSGPRSPVALGLEASEATQHILRLLESSYLGFQDSMEGVWHENGKEWIMQDKEFKLVDPSQSPKTRDSMRPQEPRLLALQFSDARTALAHVKGRNGEDTVLSLLRITSQIGQADNSAFYNGWRIIRSVSQQYPDANDPARSVYADIEKCIDQYYAVEHGGGRADVDKARAVFHPSASLLTVGIAPVHEPATTWAAPSGSLLEIPLKAYMEGAQAQIPHNDESRKYDQVLGLHVLPCRSVAAVSLRVGNGTCSSVYHDHLLLGKQKNCWLILSKVFSVHGWH